MWPLPHGHRIYALREEPVFIESVPDETCLVEPGEIHFGDGIYRERNHMSEQGICLVVMHANRFEVIAVDYVGVMSEAKQTELKGRLLAEAQAVAAAVAGSQPALREKKFRDRLGRFHEETIGKNPYIKLITPSDAPLPLSRGGEGGGV
jgi:mRNA degradation ribonuclease J1/J2